MQQWQSEDLITPQHCLRYRVSDHVQNFLPTIHQWQEKGASTVDKDIAVHLCDYLMFMISMGNAA